MSLLWKTAVAGGSTLHVLNHEDPEGAFEHLARHHGLTKSASPFKEKPGELVDDVKKAHDPNPDRSGFTVHSQRGDAPKGGFVVSEAKNSERRIPLADLKTDHIRQYTNQHHTLLEHPQRWLGCWVDHKDDGTKDAVLDVNRIYESEHDATRHGLATDQDAIYDIANKRAIELSKPPAHISRRWGHLMDSNKALVANSLSPSPDLPWATRGDF